MTLTPEHLKTIREQAARFAAQTLTSDMLQREYTDLALELAEAVPKLLDHIDGLNAEIARLQDALRDLCDAAEGVVAGVRHIEMMEYASPSAVAEMCSYFNGYEGNPDLGAAVDAARALLEKDRDTPTGRRQLPDVASE